MVVPSRIQNSLLPRADTEQFVLCRVFNKCCLNKTDAYQSQFSSVCSVIITEAISKTEEAM